MFLCQSTVPISNPWLPLFYFVFVLTILALPEHLINGIIQFVAFWIWLLSLSIMYLLATHVLHASINPSILLLNRIVLHTVPQFVYPFNSWRTSALFLVFGNYQHCNKLSHTVLFLFLNFSCEHVFYFSWESTQEWDFWVKSLSKLEKTDITCLY